MSVKLTEAAEATEIGHSLHIGLFKERSVVLIRQVAGKENSGFITFKQKRANLPRLSRHLVCTVSREAIQSSSGGLEEA